MPVIPFEESPLEVQSLAGLVTGGSVVGGGAMLGLGAVGGMGPLLFVAVPAGIIIVAASLAVSEGLRYHILRLMGVPDQAMPTPSEPEASS